MSASGKWPGPRKGVQRLRRANWSSRAGHWSQKSSLTRQRLAWVATSVPSATGVAPGDRLSTIGRPARSTAARIAAISGKW